MTLLALSVAPAWAGERCFLFLSSSLSARSVSHNVLGWGGGRRHGRAREVSLTPALTSSSILSVKPEKVEAAEEGERALRLLSVRLYLRPGRCVSQTAPKMVCQYPRSVWVEPICPKNMAKFPEQIEVINVVDPLETTGFAEPCIQ